MILDAMTSLRDSSYPIGDPPFTLLISCILEDIGFQIDPTLGVEPIYAHLDESSQAKHYGNVYGPMAPPTHHDPQDVAQQATQVTQQTTRATQQVAYAAQQAAQAAQQASQEALIEKDKFQAME